MNKLQKYVEEMIERAAKAEKADDALKFSQAACNASNAMCSLVHVKKESGDRTL